MLQLAWEWGSVVGRGERGWCSVRISCSLQLVSPDWKVVKNNCLHLILLNHTNNSFSFIEVCWSWIQKWIQVLYRTGRSPADDFLWLSSGRCPCTTTHACPRTVSIQFLLSFVSEINILPFRGRRLYSDLRASEKACKRQQIWNLCPFTGCQG